VDSEYLKYTTKHKQNKKTGKRLASPIVSLFLLTNN